MFFLLLLIAIHLHRTSVMCYFTCTTDIENTAPLYVIFLFFFLLFFTLTKLSKALRWTYDLHVTQLYKCPACYLFETGIVYLYNVQIEGASVHKCTEASRVNLECYGDYYTLRN